MIFFLGWLLKLVLLSHSRVPQLSFHFALDRWKGNIHWKLCSICPGLWFKVCEAPYSSWDIKNHYQNNMLKANWNWPQAKEKNWGTLCSARQQTTEINIKLNSSVAGLVNLWMSNVQISIWHLLSLFVVRRDLKTGAFKNITILTAEAKRCSLQLRVSVTPVI